MGDSGQEWTSCGKSQPAGGTMVVLGKSSAGLTDIARVG